MKAVVFPGQGSQRPGMGADIFGRFPELVAEADAILGLSIENLCLNNPDARLDKTEFTQPAIFVVSVLRYRDLSAQAPAPAFVAGHSLGEYMALAVAEVFDFATGLRIVQRRGLLMGEAYGGGLVAILGVDADRVAHLLSDKGITGVEIANINSPEQVVVGGRKDRLQKLLEACDSQSIRAVPLRVSGAFHTSHMAEAAAKFADFLSEFEFAPPKIPVISNVTGRPHEAGGIGQRLMQQMVKPVLWSQCVETMLEAGVTEFVEIGTPPILMPIIANVRRHVDARRSESAPAPAPAPTRAAKEVPSRYLGENGFCRNFNCARPVISGSLGHGISGTRLVQALAKAGVLSFLDTEGWELEAIDDALAELSANPDTRSRFGVSLRADLEAPDADERLVNLLLRNNVRCIEVSGYPEPSGALLRYRAESRQNAAHGDTHNRVIARVGTVDAASAFLLGALPVPKHGKISRHLPEIAQAPWVDALCIDLQAWRSNGGAPWSLFLAALEWRDAYSQRANGAPFFVGASGTIWGPESVTAPLAMGADFTSAGSIYLLADEACLDEDTKRALRGGTGRYEEVPDWHYPELGTRSWSFVRDRLLSQAAWKLHELYATSNADARGAHTIASDLPEPFASRLRDVAERHLSSDDSREFRTILRQVGKTAFFPGIIACDASIAQFSKHLPQAETERLSGISAAQLSDLLCPRDADRTNYGEAT